LYIRQQSITIRSMVRSITEDRKTIKKEKRVLFEEKLAIRFFFGEYMKKKKVQKKRKRNKHSKFFKMLMKSVNEAV
ncbi:hypothetical protein, partial [Klebsiella pneumoniae]|uniref:hypothetical protein n=1 Tax=Klebsiella pneumoniae TaxID=573 RepID=UPI001967ADC6